MYACCAYVLMPLGNAISVTWNISCCRHVNYPFILHRSSWIQDYMSKIKVIIFSLHKLLLIVINSDTVTNLRSNPRRSIFELV